MDFRKIQFGKADAKEEGSDYPELLIKGYFDSAKVAQKALEESTFLFLGYKGSGKTALSEHLRLTHLESHNTFVTDAILEDFPYKNLAKIVSGDTDIETKLSTAWKWILLLYSINSFDSDAAKTLLDTQEWETSVEILKKQNLLPTTKITDIVKISSKHTFKTQLPAIFQYTYEKFGQPTGVNLDHVITYLRTSLKNIKTSSRHYIVIDGLDEILSSREIQYQSIAALIIQAKSTNLFFKQNDIPMKILVLCRTDIFERLPLPNKNKIRQDSAHKFNWFDESFANDYSRTKLIELANLRGKVKYPELTDIFAKFFPQTYESTPICQALLEYTRHTPRDFLQLLKYIQKYCRGEKVDAGAITMGIKSYCSEYFLPEIKDELVGYANPQEIDIIIAFLSSLTKNRVDGNIMRKAKESNPSIDFDALFKVLFECSAIGLLVGERESEKLFYLKFRNPNKTYIPTEPVALHKALWKALH